MRLLLLIILSSSFARAQHTHASEDILWEHPVWCGVDFFAFYPGGEEAFVAYMSEDMNYRYCIPTLAKRPMRVYVSFTLNKDGSITNVAVDRGICPEIDDKVAKRIRKMKCNSTVWARHMRIPVQVELRE